MTTKQLEDILKESRRFAIPAMEKNIFSIGGRGHYENPISDLLAFFMNRHEIHGFGDLVLKSFNEAAELSPNDTDLIVPPLREVRTADEKKIDILLVGEGYVTIIENKIRHWAANPFNSYETYLNQHYKDKTPNRVLLSVSQQKPPPGWSSLTYKKLLVHIKENLGEYVVKIPYSKWLILFREFLLNIEQECEPDPMTNDNFEFVCKNYGAIHDLKIMANNYINELQKKGLDAIRIPTDTDDSDVVGHKEDWNEEGVALRLHRTQWGGKSNITLLLRPTGSFTVQFYVYDISDDGARLRTNVDNRKYGKHWIEQNTIHCFGYVDNQSLDTILKEIQDVVQKLNTYYCGVSVGVETS